MKKRQAKLSAIICFMIVMLFAAGIPCYSASYPGAEDLIVKSVEKVEPSVVNIKAQWQARDGRWRNGNGSGIIISKEGWIITNAHVTRNASKIIISLTDGKKIQAREWRADSSEDIAVIKIDPVNLPVASLGDSGNLKKGQVAVAIGNPLSFESTVTIGCISATGRHLEARNVDLKDMIQTDAAINPGNSGGALINSKGEVIGINTLVFTGNGTSHVSGLGFAIPINRAISVAKSLIARKGASAQKPWFGISASEIGPEMGLPAKKGIMITGFFPYSPARTAGLKTGDIILSVADYTVTNINDLRRALSKFKAGDTVFIKLIRDNQSIGCSVKLEGIRQ